MRIRHHHVRPGPPFFDQRDVVASDVPHDEIVGGALVAARREIRVVAVGAGEFPEGTVFDGVDGGPTVSGASTYGGFQTAPVPTAPTRVSFCGSSALSMWCSMCSGSPAHVSSDA